jgi:HD superfamily phosphohydrolase
MDTSAKPWYIADPVHNFVEFGPHQAVVKALVASREFQRLRRITQLGLASFVFPGAVHSRFSHSLGAAHLAARLVEQLELAPGDAAIVVCAALLHDIGHGPFSHSFERALERVNAARPTHEDWTRLIITQRLADTLRAHGVDPTRVCALIHQKPDDPVVPAFWRQMISSQIDVDRMDYLCRDAHFSGVTVGRIDLQYLVRNIRIIQHGSQQTLGLLSKGVSCFEAFAFARHVMNKSVYYHKQVATFECMMEECIRLLVEGSGLAYEPRLIAVLRSTKASKGDELQTALFEPYLDVTEDQIWCAVSAAAERSDPLGRMCSMLVDRKPVRSLRVAEHKHKVLKEELSRAGFQAHQCSVRTLPSGLYKQDSGEQIFLIDEHGDPPEHISKKSPLVSAFHDQMDVEAVLVIFDGEAQAGILDVAKRAHCLETESRRSPSKPPVKIRDSQAPASRTGT